MVAHDYQVSAIFDQALQQLLAVGHIQAHLDLTVLLAERRQQAWREIVGGTGHRDGQTATLQALHLVHHLFQFIELRGNGLGIAAEFMTGLGQEHLLAQLFEQWQTDRVFQLLDLHGHGGLVRCSASEARV